jgi:hypothetical protein
LSRFDAVFTHNGVGEYGSEHHRSVYRYVTSVAKVTAYFGYGGVPDFDITLTYDELAQKLKALQCYDHTTKTDRQPKWKALIARYFAGDVERLRRESYEIRR